jgi:hypothetical protein
MVGGVEEVLPKDTQGLSLGLAEKIHCQGVAKVQGSNGREVLTGRKGKGLGGYGEWS